MQALVKEFRTFLLRGNLVDMAVGIVIGIAFAALVTALVTDLITPIIAAIVGRHDFSALTFTIHKSRFLYGDFINALITFVSIAAAVFFFVVKPVNALMAPEDGAAGRRDGSAVPGVPQRDPERSPALRVLHRAGRTGLGIRDKREARRDRAAAADLVDDVHGVVLPISAGYAPEQRQPAPETEGAP